ncbi:MAG: hypothetical protein AB1515_08665 [Nitrospirota bacterium]
MRQFAFARSFSRSLKGLSPKEKIAIQGHIDAFMLAMDAGQIPPGFGLKKLAGNLWEIRSDLATRILFHWKQESLTFLFVGNHNEVQRFLRYYLS